MTTLLRANQRFRCPRAGNSIQGQRAPLAEVPELVDSPSLPPGPATLPPHVLVLLASTKNLHGNTAASVKLRLVIVGTALIHYGIARTASICSGGSTVQYSISSTSSGLKYTLRLGLWSRSNVALLGRLGISPPHWLSKSHRATLVDEAGAVGRARPRDTAVLVQDVASDTAVLVPAARLRDAPGAGRTCQCLGTFAVTHTVTLARTQRELT